MQNVINLTEYRKQSAPVKPLKGMVFTGMQTTNVYCGQVRNGKQVYGCGAIPNEPFNQYRYTLKGYKSLWSSVSLCPNCVSKLNLNKKWNKL